MYSAERQETDSDFSALTPLPADQGPPESFSQWVCSERCSLVLGTADFPALSEKSTRVALCVKKYHDAS